MQVYMVEKHDSWADSLWQLFPPPPTQLPPLQKPLPYATFSCQSLDQTLQPRVLQPSRFWQFYTAELLFLKKQTSCSLVVFQTWVCGTEHLCKETRSPRQGFTTKRWAEKAATLTTFICFSNYIINSLQNICISNQNFFNFAPFGYKWLF